MKVLMPSIVDPVIQRGGAWTVTRALLTVLQDESLRAEVDVVPVPLRTPLRHRARQCLAVGQSLIRGSSSKIEFSRSRRMSARVDALRDPDYDLVVVNGTDLSWLLPHLPPTMKRILIAHNIEHKLFASQMQERLGSRGVLGWLVRRDYQHLIRCELDGLRRAGNVIFLSSEDASYAVQQLPDLRTLTVPPLFDGEPGTRPARTEGTDGVHLGMLANFGWWPNRQGLEWFLERVFPHLRPTSHVHLFGHRSREVGPSHTRIHRHGYQEDLDDVWRHCDFIICPETSGGGVSVKAAEALFHGLPLVGSPFSVRGLPLDPDPSIVLLDGPREWIEFLNTHGTEMGSRAVPFPISKRFSLRHRARDVSDFVLDAVFRESHPEMNARPRG